MVTDKGNVFGWGNSEYAQLLMEGENQQINIATELSALKKLGHIVDIACGGCFCMVLNSKYLSNCLIIFIIIHHTICICEFIRYR